MVKTIKILTAAVFILALAVFIAGFVPVSHPAITGKAVMAVRQAGFDSCTARSVQVTLWKGLTVRGLNCSGPLAAGRCRVQAEALILRGNSIKAFFVYKKTDRRAAAVAFRKSRLAAAAHLCGSAGGGFSMAAVSSACIVIAEEKRPPVLLRGFSMTAFFAKNGCSGSFSVDSLWYADLPAAQALSGNFSSSNDIFRLSKCKASSFGGALQCGGRADLLRRAVGEFTLSINGFDFNEWYKYSDTVNGRFSGQADFRLLLDSSAMALDSLHGRGTVTAARFGVSGFPFQRTLASAAGYSALASLRFRKTAAVFIITPGGVITTEAAGHNDSLSIKTMGWFSTKGTLDQKAECTVPKRAVGALPRFVRETLEETADGGRVLRLRIFGALENPKFTIDSKAVLQKAVRNIFDEVRNNLNEWLK